MAEPPKPSRAAPTLAKKASSEAQLPAANATEKVLTGEPSVLYPIGLKTASGKYVTVENFGDQLNANGPALRTKQVFVMETDGLGKFAFKASNGKYLSADFREVKVSSVEKGTNEYFSLAHQDGVTKIYTSEGKVLSAEGGKLSVCAPSSNVNEDFEIQINYHPQICLITQKRYIAVNGSEVVSNRDTQFGRETLLTREEADKRGHYGLKAVNDNFLVLDSNGKLSATSKDMNSAAALFIFEFHGNNLAIRCAGNGKYLTVSGNGLKAERTTVTLKEIFKVVDSDAQITMRAHNGKYVGFQGTNLITSKTDVTNEEIYILESVGSKWAFRTFQDIYWSMKPDGTLAVDGRKRTDAELFVLEFPADHPGKTAIKGPNGKYLAAKPLGGIEAKASEVNGQALFEVFFLNRPQLVLQTNQQSFVGTSENKVRTNRSKPEVFDVEFKEGKYALKTTQGKYLKEESDAKIGLSNDIEWFCFEFYNGQLAIKTLRGKYLRSENQGWLIATADKVESTELFEF